MRLVKGSIRDWLQLFRAQTAFATIYTLLIPYMYAGGRELVLPLVLVGLLVHYSSFGHNSVMDYYHDLEDVNKVHHPLTSGRIRYDDAVKAVNLLQVISAISLILLTLYTGRLFSLVFLLLYVVFGHVYNDGVDHVSLHSWIPISISFASLTVYSLLLQSSSPFLILVFFLLGVNVIFYQIAYEGNKKDFSHEDNLYSRYGMYGNGKRSILFEVFFMLDRLLINSLLILILLPHTLSNTLLFVVFTLFEAYSVYHVHVEYIDRLKMLRYFGMAEAFEFFRVLTILSPIYLLLLVIIGLGYFVLMNKYLWNTDFAPRV
jgi:4-hydroxybenzoate polyprenyltransferase